MHTKGAARLMPHLLYINYTAITAYIFLYIFYYCCPVNFKSQKISSLNAS